jgi:hypothetical protein
MSSGGSKVPLPIIRDKKSGNSYSAAGDDDINDVAAMGGVNLQEEANVSNLVTLLAVLRIRIHRIYMFLGLPGPDPQVRGMDPDPDPSIVKQK